MITETDIKVLKMVISLRNAVDNLIAVAEKDADISVRYVTAARASVNSVDSHMEEIANLKRGDV